MEARSPSTRPSARRTGPVVRPPRCPVPGSMRLKADALRAPCTFSQTTSLGRIAVIAWNMDSHRPERVSLVMPARAPASERSVQGEPPQITSTGSTWLVDSRDVTEVGHVGVMVGEDGLGTGFDVAHPCEACRAEGELYAEVEATVNSPRTGFRLCSSQAVASPPRGCRGRLWSCPSRGRQVQRWACPARAGRGPGRVPRSSAQ
jgi:hypothetical protein